MFNFFRKTFNKEKVRDSSPSFEIELTASVLAYEIARIDGDVSEEELEVLIEEIEQISTKVNKSKAEILEIIETYSNNSVSFYEFIEDINKYYKKEEKLELLQFMWRTAYADGRLDTDEERLIRRLANLINIKDIDVLKLKDSEKTSS